MPKIVRLRDFDEEAEYNKQQSVPKATQLQIHHDGGVGLSLKLKRVLGSKDRTTIVDHPSPALGGGIGLQVDDLFEIVKWGIIISVSIFSKNFIAELGKELGKNVASKLIKILSGKKEPIKIIVTLPKKKQRIQVYIRKELSSKQALQLLESIDAALSKVKMSREYFYNTKTKELVDFSLTRYFYK
jgi:hypothetical protein